MLREIDYTIFHFINQTISNTTFDFILPILRTANNWIPLYIFLFLFLLYKYKTKAITYTLYILIAFALADLIAFQFLKPLIGRLRPCHSTTLHVRLLLNHCGGKYSFPSSHATNHMAIALSIVFAKIFQSKCVNLAWILWATIIGFAQIYVGVHYPLDVLGGFIIGAIIAFVNYKFILPILPFYKSITQ